MSAVIFPREIAEGNVKLDQFPLAVENFRDNSLAQLR